MIKQNLCIIGIGETAERVYNFCKRYNLYNIVGFAVDKCFIQEKTFSGLPIFPLENLEQYIDKSNCLLFVALFWNNLNGDRRRLYERMKKHNWQFATIVSPHASIRGNIGENCWVMDYVVTQENSFVGDNVFIADFVFVGHSAIIESHCFLGARSTIMGSAVIGEQSFIGISATVFDVVSIGKKCLVGACSIQKYNMPDCSVCKISTTNNIIKQYQENEIESKWVAKHPNRLNKNRTQ